jgi:hypothetical protein
VKVTYDLNGRPVEEEFYAVYYSVDVPYDGPQGRTWQTNWGLTSLHSFRASAGTLDTRRPIFAAVAKSFRPNPAWMERLTAINAYLQQQFNRQIQAGYDQIAAAAALSRQISANNDAMIAAIDRQLEASRAASASRAAEARSANEKFPTTSGASKRWTIRTTGLAALLQREVPLDGRVRQLPAHERQPVQPKPDRGGELAAHDADAMTTLDLGPSSFCP